MDFKNNYKDVVLITIIIGLLIVAIAQGRKLKNQNDEAMISEYLSDSLACQELSEIYTQKYDSLYSVTLEIQNQLENSVIEVNYYKEQLSNYNNSEEEYYEE